MNELLNESFHRWDNSAAQFMVQMQTNNSQGFCRHTQKVKSLYVLSADAHQFFGQGMIDVETYLPNVTGLVNYTICTDVNSDIFMSEFLNKISSDKLYSCEPQYNQRFDIKLQQCMLKFDIAGQKSLATIIHYLRIVTLLISLFISMLPIF